MARQVNSERGDTETRELQRLAERIGYPFRDVALLELALTHRSRSGRRNNERLEFLGDALLGFLVGDELFRRHPNAKEQQLTLMRASVVRGATLAEAARAIDLGDFLVLGESARKSGGFRRESILADALEAIIGAVYLDGGIDAARGLVCTLLGAHIDAARPERIGKDPKTRLQELLQGHGEALPRYEVVDIGGNAHARAFVVECHVDARELCARGTGSSRRKAEQRAAAAALAALEPEAST